MDINEAPRLSIQTSTLDSRPNDSFLEEHWCNL